VYSLFVLLSLAPQFVLLSLAPQIVLLSLAPQIILLSLAPQVAQMRSHFFLSCGATAQIGARPPPFGGF
jgi:hypothetical protein